MMKRLFSKENQTVQKSTEPGPSPPQEIEYQNATNNLNKEISKLQQSSEKIEDKLEDLDKIIKQLIKEKKKKQAQNKIKEAQGYKKQLERFEQQTNALIHMKIRVETDQTNKSSVSCISDVNKLLKETNKWNDQMQEEIYQYQDFLAAESEQDQMWKQLENQETQNMDIDGELERIEAEMEMQEALNQKNMIQKIPSASTQSSSLKQSQQSQQSQQGSMIKSMEKLLI